MRKLPVMSLVLLRRSEWSLVKETKENSEAAVAEDPIILGMEFFFFRLTISDGQSIFIHVPVIIIISLQLYSYKVG